ncbi:HNH endonuclease [Pseudarthrobacter oxydans]|uniref:HNH endonuclease n=1 Tax=Pseudarthrobacter oxydans TaxID=1671 RepID=UPI00381D0E60
MILNPIVYCEASSALVARYDSQPDKASTYWSEEEVTPVRLEIKAYYIKEQQHLCCYCGIPDPSIHGLDWDVEHVVPQKRRPEFMFTQVNLGVACKECNGSKRDKETLVDPSASAYPLTSDAFLVVHPHFDKWSDHILRDHLTYASFTKKGKWTIEECRLNRSNERVIGLQYPISDSRYEELVRSLLAGGSTLQQIANHIRLSVPIDIAADF